VEVKGHGTPRTSTSDQNPLPGGGGLISPDLTSDMRGAQPLCPPWIVAYIIAQEQKETAPLRHYLAITLPPLLWSECLCYCHHERQRHEFKLVNWHTRDMKEINNSFDSEAANKDRLGHARVTELVSPLYATVKADHPSHHADLAVVQATGWRSCSHSSHSFCAA
jgi:hypothetical protein